MSRVMDATLYELVSSRNRVLRYLSLIWRTIGVLKADKPAVVFTQNPSIVLSLLAVILKPFFGYVLVVDEHNAGLFPLEGRSRLFNAIARFIAQRADLVLVTNKELVETCTLWGARPFIFPDPLPRFESISEPQREANQALRMVCVCTWAEDEPIEEIIAAAGEFSKDQMQFYFTGNPGRRILGVDLQENIHLLGFIDDSDYLRVIREADGVIVLTKRDNCLNCAAYEATALEKPGLLSDKSALRQYFHQGFVYVGNSPKAIAQGLRWFQGTVPELKRQIGELRVQLESECEAYINNLNKEIAELRNSLGEQRQE